MTIQQQLLQEFSIKAENLDNVIALLDEGNTIPFIARYRKELTGACDDQVLREISERLIYLRNIEKRKQEVEANIKEQGKWTDELAVALANAKLMVEVEDIYRPYKQKRKTRASVAKEMGLDPLAELILAQTFTGNLDEEAKKYLTAENGLAASKDAINGAMDIIAEQISDDADIRKSVRAFLNRSALIATKLNEAEKNAAVYDMYKEYSEPIRTIPSHRILAINRGETEKCLKVAITFEKDGALEIIQKKFIKDNSTTLDIMKEVIDDSLSRLIFPSLEREIRSELTDIANEQAIKMFEVNLKPVLMQAPLKGKVILGFDPAYRTGCKIAVVSATGDMLTTDVVYPTAPQNKTEEAKVKLLAMIKKFKVEVISIGNGTASKESEIFVSEMIKEFDLPISYIVTNEAGASVYSASKLGATEFPELDVSLRSAISIARRVQDPLAELIKIDVKQIGVGQYQHDMPQKRLSEVLDGVVEDCVNKVGVDITTASPSLLTFVAGLNSSIAKNIVEYRKENAFKSKKDLLKVSKLGEKAFTQCAGFVRVPGAKNVLDNTSVHPEAYAATEKLLTKFGYTDADVASGNVASIKEKIAETGIEKVATECAIGALTLSDIVDELLKPNRDVRDSLPPPVLRRDLLSLKDLQVGMEVEGTVRNVIDFGVFVDIGVHQDGLVHISEMANSYIKHPSDILKVGDRVVATVISVDVEKNKIALSLKNDKFTQTQAAKVAPQNSRPRAQSNTNISAGGVSVSTAASGATVGGAQTANATGGNRPSYNSKRDNFGTAVASSEGKGYKEYGANGKNQYGKNASGNSANNASNAGRTANGNRSANNSTNNSRGNNDKGNSNAPEQSLESLLSSLANKYSKK